MMDSITLRNAPRCPERPRTKAGTHPAHSRHGSCRSVGRCRSSTSSSRADAPSAAVSGHQLCGTCLLRLVRCAPPWCERCGAPGPWPVRRCAECGGRRLAFASARGALVYDAGARALVASWKERGRRDLAVVAAELVVAGIPRPDVDVVTFVPGDRDRGLRRGHAPAAALAAELAAAWSIPIATLLRRRPGIDRQRDLPRAERRGNVAGAFSPRGTVPAARVPHRRRLHHGLDGDGLRDGAAPSGRAPGRRRVFSAGSPVVGWMREIRRREMEDRPCNSSSPPVTTTRVRPPASTRRPSCRSSIAVFTISP